VTIPAIKIAGGTFTGNIVQAIAGGLEIRVSGTSTISNNIVIATPSGAGDNCAVEIVGTAQGASINNNQITISTNGAGANYGVCVKTSGGGVFTNNNDISHNTVESQNGTGSNDAAVRFDNTAAVSGGQVIGNRFAYNTGQGVGFMVSRLDAQNNQNFYIQNTGNAGAIFDSGGSTTDVVTQTDSAFTFATLPIAGVGSLIYCSNCQPGSITAAGGQGALLTRTVTEVAGAPATNWTGNEAVIGQDTHTAEITGNYAAVILIPSTAPTGSYLVTIYTEVSTSVATSTIVASIAYADDTGAQTQNGVLFNGTTAGTVQSLTFPVRFVTGTALTYSTTTANSPKYKIFARVHAL
jgi:hypothetical protein